MWRFIRWSDHQYYPANKCGGLYVGPTTNIRHGILVVFANRPPVGPTTPVRRGALLVGPTTPVRRGGLLMGPTMPVRRGGLLVGPTENCESPPSFIWEESVEGRGKPEKRRHYYPANNFGGLYVGPTTNIRQGILVVFANRPVYCEGPPSFIRGESGEEGVSQKKEALLPSKQICRFIRWSDHQYKAWDIGGFCKSATYRWDRPRRSDVGVYWWVQLFTVKAHPALIGGSQGRGGGEPEKRRHYYPANNFGGLYVGPTTNIRHGILVVFANLPPVGPTFFGRESGERGGSG